MPLLKFVPLLKLLKFPPLLVHLAPCMAHLAPCMAHPPPCQVHLSQPAPLVGMHVLNYISIPLDYIVHVQVLRLQYCPPCPAVSSPPPPGEGDITTLGGGGLEGEGEEEVLVGVAQT